MSRFKSRRKLEAGPDGMAAVMVLTDPIPRHLSIVHWGANDRPATAWMSAGPHVDLREPPSQALLDTGALTLAAVQGFVLETLDAWRAVCAAIMGKALTSEERGAQIRSASTQAQARIASLAAATSSVIGTITRSHKSVNVEPPAPQANPTFNGELDRRAFAAGLDQACVYLMERTLAAMRDTGAPSVTESILLAFAEVTDIMSSWAESLPAGVVGVAQMAGAKHSKEDIARLNEIKRLLGELAPEKPDTTSADSSATPPTESTKMITLADLQRIATENPVGFAKLMADTHKAAKLAAPQEAKNFAFGDTGVEQYDSAAIMNALRGMGPGSGLEALIAGAIGGIDLNKAVTGDSPQVAASMRSAIERMCVHALTNDPNGALAASIRAVVAPSVASAISQTLKSILSDPARQPSVGGQAGFGLTDYQAEESTDPLAVAFPQLASPVGR